MTLAFACQRSALLPAVDAAKRAVKKSKIPVLNNVLVTAEGDRVRVAGTDTVLTIRANCEASEIEVAGGVSVDADLFLNTIRRMPEGRISIREADGTITVRGGKASGKLHVLLASDHPQVDVGAVLTSFELPAADIGRIAEHCAFAMSTNEVRHYLCGTYLHATGDTLVAVATDGFVLSKLALSQPEDAAGMNGIIVPDIAVRQLALLTGKADDTVRVDVADGFVTFSAGNLSLSTRLVEATYPDYARLIPKREGGVSIDVAAFRGAVDRILLYAPEGKERWNDIKCIFEPGRVSMATRSEKGEAADEIEAEGEQTITIGWNARKLLDVVTSIKGSRMRLELGEGAGASRIVDLEDDTRELVIMPIALKW